MIAARAVREVFLGLAVLAWVAGAAQREPPSEDSDATANAFLAALKEKDFDAATSRFNPTVKRGMPPEALAVEWNAQLAKLGSLRSWQLIQRDRLGAKDVRIALVRCERGEVRFTLWIERATQQFTGVTFAPVAPSRPPAPYAIAARFRAVDVQVGSAPFVLGGTLTVPVGRGPFPAAVLVHGSGPQDRDESIGANKPFRDLAEGLATRGIAVLRYDKRTFQYGYRIMEMSNIADEVVFDAVAAVKALKARPEIDPGRIFVIGHSLGALLAPEIALKSAPAAGAVLMAPPGRAPWDTILAQMRYLEAPAEEIAEFEKSVELLKSHNLGSKLLLGAPAWYWDDLANRDGIGKAKELHRPLLILHGLRDYQVTEEDLAAWEKGLAGTPMVEFARFPADNHLFISGTGKPSATEYEREGHVDVKVIEKLSAFLLRRAPPVEAPKL